jgi:hypothetical protein
LAALDGIRGEAAEWRAGLLVVGSHGKGWGTPMLVGSVTEQLVNDLPTSLLVVPTAVVATEPEADRHVELAQSDAVGRRR